MAGFAKPGDYVDVILVEKGSTGATSRFLLKNVLLLGINQEAAQEKGSKDDKDKGKSKSKPAIATLALQPDDMLQLVSAAAVGEIYLALRPFHTQDTENFLNAYTTNKSVQGSDTASSAPVRPSAPQTVYQAPPAAAPAVSYTAPATPRSAGYEIIQGDKVVAN